MKLLENIPNCAKCKNVQRGTSLFSGCAFAELEKSFPNKKYYLFEEGEHLYKKGGAVEGFFCIYSGKVKVCQIDENYKEKILYHVHAGEAVMFTNIELRWYYANSAVAVQRTRACFIPRSDFNDVLNLLMGKEKHEKISTHEDTENT